MITYATGDTMIPVYKAIKNKFGNRDQQEHGQNTPIYAITQGITKFNIRLLLFVLLVKKSIF